MFPYIYQSTDFTIGSYGVMLAVAYLTGRHLYIRGLNNVLEKPVNTEILIFSLLIFGVVGAKIMFIFKNPEAGSFLQPSTWLSPKGFSSQGAISSAFLVILIFSRLTQTKLNLLLDSAAPAAIIAYALARLGCFLSGDDCWGVDSNLPWAMSFPHGIKPTSIGQTVHPLPLYEIIYSILIWLFLTIKQRSQNKPFHLFYYLLTLWGFSRFLIEFISTNPVKIFGMTGSQFGALLMFITGLVLLSFSPLIVDKKKPGK